MGAGGGVFPGYRPFIGSIGAEGFCRHFGVGGRRDVDIIQYFRR